MLQIDEAYSSRAIQSNFKKMHIYQILLGPQNSIIQFKIYLYQMIQKVVNVLHQFQAEKGAKIIVKTLGLIEKRPGTAPVKEFRRQLIQGTLYSPVQEQQLKSITKKIEEDTNIKPQLKVGLEVGKLLKDYGPIDNVFGEGKTQLKHKPNEVLYITVWASWSGASQLSMQYNQKMITNNEQNWKEKVRVIGVCVDNEKGTVENKVNQKNLEKIHHLALIGARGNHQLLKDYKIREYPFVCLVNKWGIVDYIGNPTKTNIQKRINQLISQEKQGVPIQIKQEPRIKRSQSKIQTDKIKTLLSKDQIQKEFKGSDLAVIKYLTEDRLQNGIQTSHSTIFAYIIEGDNAAQKIVNQIFGGLEGKVAYKIQKVKYGSVTNVQNPNCSLCNESKGMKYPYYWLKWEGTKQGKFGCRTCVQKKSDIAQHHYNYEKNSVLMFGPWSQVGEKHIGKNVQPQHPRQIQSNHQFICNGCRKSTQGIGHARYVCLGCHTDPNFANNGLCDLCDLCMLKLINKDEKVVNIMNGQGHASDHPFLRILYNVKNYNDY